MPIEVVDTHRWYMIRGQEKYSQLPADRVNHRAGAIDHVLTMVLNPP